MKRRVFLAGSLVLVSLLLGCARERQTTNSAPAHSLSFSQAGVAMELGGEWQASHMGAEHNLYPPTLTGPAGMIRVVLLPPDRSEPGRVADGLRAEFDQNPAAAPHSFRRQEFVNNNGVKGICISYSQRVDKDSATERVNRHYLLQNRGGRCVAIQYLAAAGTDGEPIHHLIRSSLSLR